MDSVTVNTAGHGGEIPWMAPGPTPGVRAGDPMARLSWGLPFELRGRRVLLRPLRPDDFDQWAEVRRRCSDWLLRWEPRAPFDQRDPDRRSFAARCGSRERERQLGSAYGFGIFVGGRFAGEINLSSVQRGPFQSAYVGYWIDEGLAGHGYMPEAVVVVSRFAFEELALHRLQVSIIPRNKASRRVVEKLGLREEGVALRYLEIDGAWEDHVRYAITLEE
ncbi:MAG: GNAT family N-acetyltransferase, partial [Acidimicrobiales bacterium]